MALATLLSGFLLNFAIGSDLPPRTMTQLPLVFAGLFATLLVVFRCKPAILIVPVIFLCVGAAASNKLFYSDYMARKSDSFFAQQLITAIYQKYPNFDVNSNPVYFYGSYSPINSWKIPNADVFGHSFFEWDGGNNRRMYLYFSTANLIKFVEPNAQQVDQSIQAAKVMATWPARESINKVNGVVIVKLSDKLSPYNR
ncbi:hypothetical protein O3W44_19165 [Pantoea sp. LMR881]|uniref:hypothetical protein n=1 Tax=Pantoea sp. LMR881 TaxID=3014336 RepID=UPI0022AFDBFB|nr:hypothetical protein [Pantoea sp. LMR881]MCZ4060764.1 hypothetical protein [Pantoea sp. LMR881]